MGEIAGAGRGCIKEDEEKKYSPLLKATIYLCCHSAYILSVCFPLYYCIALLISSLIPFHSCIRIISLPPMIMMGMTALRSISPS